MKFIYLTAGALVLSGVLYAQESCQQMQMSLEKHERAYERQGTEDGSSEARGRFVRAAEEVLARCRHTLSFEERHRLQKSVDDAKSMQIATPPPRPASPLRDPRGREEYQRGVIRTH